MLMKKLFMHYEKKIPYILVVCAGVLLTLLLLTLSLYNHPAADDFVYSVNAQHYGFWGAQFFWYMHWCGRYFSTLLLSMNPLIHGSFIGYKLLSALLILLSLASFYFFINMLFKRSGVLEKWHITFLCFFAFILLMPSVAEAYYWMAGAYSYQMGNILTLFLFILMMSYTEKPSTRKFLLSIVVVIALAGTNEVSMFFQVLMLMFVMVFHLIRFRKIPRYYVVLCALALVGSLVVYLAPGNAYRASFQTQNHQLVFSMKSAVVETIDVMSHWWWIAGFIILTTYSIANHAMRKDEKHHFEHLYLNPFVVIALIGITVALGFFTCYWSLGLYPPMRTINTMYFYCIIGAVYTGICLAVMLQRAKIRVPDLSRVAWLILLLLLLYVYKYPNNVKTAYQDFRSGTAQSYDKELTARYRSLLTNPNRSCSINKLHIFPKTLYFKDITENTDIVMLRNYEAFFDKDSIAVVD